MKTFRFTFTIANQSVCSNEMAEATFVAGGDDASVGSKDGRVSVHFDRDAETLDEAIRSAAMNLGKAGFQVSHIDIDDETLQLIAG